MEKKTAKEQDLGLKLLSKIFSVSSLVMIFVVGLVNQSLWNQISTGMKMIGERDSQGLSGILLSNGGNDAVVGGLLNFLQIVGVVFDRGALYQAAMDVMGPTRGKAMLIISGVLAMMVAYGLGIWFMDGIRWVGNRIGIEKKTGYERLRSWFCRRKETITILLLLLAFNGAMLKYGWVAVAFYIVGIAEVDLKKFLMIATIGFLLI